MLECIQRLSNHTGATLGVTVDPWHPPSRRLYGPQFYIWYGSKSNGV